MNAAEIPLYNITTTTTPVSSLSSPASICLDGECITPSQLHAVTHPGDAWASFFGVLFQAVGFIVCVAAAFAAVVFVVIFFCRLHRMLSSWEKLNPLPAEDMNNDGGVAEQTE